MPTVLFLKPEGEEIDRICGFDGNKDAYLQTIKDYAAGRNILSNYIADVQNNPDNVELNLKLARKYISRWEREKAHPYFTRVLELDPDDEKGFKDESTFQLAVYEARNKKNIEPLESFMASNTDERFFEEGYFNLVRFYRNEKNTDKLIEIYEEGIGKMPAHAGALNQYAWFIYENKIKEKYVRGIELAKKAVELKPDAAYIWDTLGWLYFENGNVEAAIKTMKKAVELAPESKYYNENLEKFKKSIS